MIHHAWEVLTFCLGYYIAIFLKILQSYMLNAIISMLQMRKTNLRKSHKNTLGPTARCGGVKRRTPYIQKPKPQGRGAEENSSLCEYFYLGRCCP
jgi:hypothetical protein